MNKLYKILKAKYKFVAPEKKKILFFDTVQVLLFTKLFKFNKKNYTSVDTRLEQINLFIFFKTVIKSIFLNKKLSNLLFNYYLEYIKYVKPKVVITLIDNNVLFYKFKNYLPHTKFLSVQFGHRTEHRDLLTVIKKLKLSKKYLKSDIYFTFNKAYGNLISKYINCKAITIGSIKNNFIPIQNIKNKNTLLFISQFRSQFKDSNNNFFFTEKKLLPKIYIYCKKNKIKLNILGTSLKEPLDEKSYYTKILNSNNWNFLKRNSINNYSVVDKFENIIFIDSTLGYEAAARGKKIAVFSSRRIIKKAPPELFAWPNKMKKKDFYYSDTPSVNEIKRVLNNVTKCSEKKWEEKFLPRLKSICPYIKNNKNFREKINKIINK